MGFERRTSRRPRPTTGEYLKVDWGCFRRRQMALPTGQTQGTWKKLSLAAWTDEANNQNGVKWILRAVSVIYIKRRSSCSIVSGDMSNCSYRLSFISLIRLHLSSAWQIISRRTTQNTSAKIVCSIDSQQHVETATAAVN